ncbi:putrescine-binding periplasmic protein [Marinobacterium nitratireducens]|uniref:Putrescine-binding periplasmic protein n=1 Tax=Marinobacterium nitratireducens TaxID=518897 RepID=A0A918DY09_9GAMM|nr:polyamine ABC transporter substrate-binding protein [Marinobacterium nitratireducens]GGO88057.1 putrescine-binding periplasmic protein [Marinobacterium nitratireducens]
MTLKKTLMGAVLGSLVATGAHAQEPVLNIYNWSDYISPEAVSQFEKETGIRVNYDVYDSNEVLEAKLMSGRSGYDLVVPSAFFLERQIQAGIYAEVDRDQLSNYGNLDAQLLQTVSRNDPNNVHGVPYTWGTTGIGYNVDMVRERVGDMPIDSWDLIFKPELAAKVADCGLAVLDSPAEVVALALNYLGLDPNSESKADLDQAEALLASVQPHIKYFHSSQYISDLANGEICVALGYNGDVLQAQDRAASAGQGISVGYSIPREGSLAWFDLMAIPADAPHPEAAHKFINFVLQPEVAAGISNFVYYAVANTEAQPLLNEDVRSNPGVYPSEEVKAKLFAQNAHTAKFDRLLTRAWTRVKTGR